MKDWIEVLLRSVALFALSFIITRLMGKRNISRMTPFHFVHYIVLAVIVAMIALDRVQNVVFGFLALGVWAILPIALDYLAMKSKMVHDLVYGKETVLVKQGKIMEESLQKIRLTGEELLRDLRSKNVFNLADVEFAVMETTGDINVLLKSDKKPVTAHDLGQKVAPQVEPQTVILDGNILDEPLAALGLNRGWLKQKLEGLGVSEKNVFLGQVDSSGELYVDLFDDSIELPESKVKELLYANLEKSHADLMNYSLATKNQEAKEMYARNAEKLQKLMEKLKPYLLH